jgi:hypothetical protein
MRAAIPLAISAAFLLGLCGCSRAADDAGSTDAGRVAPAPAGESRPAHQVRELDPATGIKGAIVYGDAREVAQRAFGKPDRTDEGRRNGKAAASWAYDRLGLYLLFVENKLSQILVTSANFRFANGLGVGATFREVSERCSQDQRYTPGTEGTFPFELNHRAYHTGRIYFAKDGRTYAFLAPSPNHGNEDSGSGEKCTMIRMAESMN